MLFLDLLVIKVSICAIQRENVRKLSRNLNMS